MQSEQRRIVRNMTRPLTVAEWYALWERQTDDERTPLTVALMRAGKVRKVRTR